MDSLGKMIIRTLFIYFIVLIVFRLMGKREIGELSVFDLVVNIMIAEIAVIAIDETDTEFYKSVVPILFLMLIQMSMAKLLIKSKKVRDLVDGSPTIIINKGKISENAMRKQRYNFDDLLQQLREKNIGNIADVEFAILEPSGKLSIIAKEKDKEGELTLPLIIDGEIQQDHLMKLNKTDFWLRQQLKQQGYNDIKNISFCSFQDGQFYVDLIDES